MIDSAVRTATRTWIVDAGWCRAKRNSGSATGRFGRCRSGAARQPRGVAGVAGSVMYLRAAGADLDLAVRHARVERGLGIGGRAALHRAVGEAEHAAVPRACHAPVGDLAVAERPAAVRAAVGERADLAAVA